ALFNGAGGGAPALAPLAEFPMAAPAPGAIHSDIAVGILLSALIGSISFAGSMVACGKLQELVSGRPIQYPGQKFGNALLIAGIGTLAVLIGAGPQKDWLLALMIGGALLFRVLFVLPIGGADM